MRFVVVRRDNTFLPCEGNVLDHYKEWRDNALLAVCDNCKRYRIVRYSDNFDFGIIKTELCKC